MNLVSHTQPSSKRRSDTSDLRRSRWAPASLLHAQRPRCRPRRPRPRSAPVTVALRQMSAVHHYLRTMRRHRHDLMAVATALVVCAVIVAPGPAARGASSAPAWSVERYGKVSLTDDDLSGVGARRLQSASRSDRGSRGRRFGAAHADRTPDRAGWVLVASPSPGDAAALYAVACVSTNDCTAVGSYSTGSNTFVLVEKLGRQGLEPRHGAVAAWGDINLAVQRGVLHRIGVHRGRTQYIG